MEVEEAEEVEAELELEEEEEEEEEEDKEDQAPPASNTRAASKGRMGARGNAKAKRRGRKM